MKKSSWLPRFAVLALRRVYAPFPIETPASGRVVRYGLLLLFALPMGGSRVLADQLIEWGSGIHGLANVPEVESGIAQIAAGGRHILALSSNGVIVAWGDNNAGQTDVPPDLVLVKAVAAGDSHSVALLADGSVRAWGENSHGECTVPTDLRAVAITASGSSSGAIRADGSVAIWGPNAAGGVATPAEFEGVTQLAMGELHTLGLRANGDLVISGLAGTAVSPEATNIIAIAAGQVHSMALRADGVVFAWGIDSHGQLQVPPELANVRAIAAGGYRSVALLQDGTVREWGDTGWFDRPLPAGLTNVTQISAGSICTVAVGALRPSITMEPVSITAYSGTLAKLEAGVSGTPPLTLQWQHNGADFPGATNAILEFDAAQSADAGAYRLVVQNALGEASSVEATLTVLDAPPMVTVPAPLVGAAPGAEAVLKVTVEGSLPMSLQWSKDGVELPGATNAALVLSPVPADGAGTYTVAVSNAFGTQTGGPIVLNLLPIVSWTAGGTRLGGFPATLTNAVAVAVRDWDIPTGVALTAEGHVVGWGNPRVTRVPPQLTNAVAISAGSGFAMALQPNGRVLAWGSNPSRQTNVPPELAEVVAIAAGASHGLALKRDGTVVGWGENTFNQAVAPAGLRDVVAVTAGYSHNVALRKDGTVVAWGNNIFGQTNVPPGLDEVVGISAGGDHTLALRRDGSVVSWGFNREGQTNVPPGLDAVIGVAASDTYSVAQRHDGSLVLWGTTPITNVPPKVEGLQAMSAGRTILCGILGNETPAPFAEPLEPVYDDGVFVASFDGKRGFAYRLEFCEAFRAGAWTLGSPLSGDNNRARLFDAASVPARFYVIRRLW